jgi:hypothetical protein
MFSNKKSGKILTLALSGMLALGLSGCHSSHAQFKPAGEIKDIGGAPYTKAILLNNGKILITTRPRVLYDPKTQQSKVIPIPPDKFGWAGDSFTQTLLPDGRVFFQRQYLCSPQSKDCQKTIGMVYTPQDETLSRILLPWNPRIGSTATLLKDKKNILIFGGGNMRFKPKTFMLYDYAANTIQKFPLSEPSRIIEFHSALLLKNGQVLIAGGTYGVPRKANADIQLYDPETNTVKTIGKLNVFRQEPSLIQVDDTHVLISGGVLLTMNRPSSLSPDGSITEGGSTREIELVDLQSGRSKIVATLTQSTMHGDYQPVRLPNGDILYTGYMPHTEILNTHTMQLKDGPPQLLKRGDHAAVEMPNGNVYLFGGYPPRVSWGQFFAGKMPGTFPSVEYFDYKDYNP